MYSLVALSVSSFIDELCGSVWVCVVVRSGVSGELCCGGEFLSGDDFGADSAASICFGLFLFTTSLGL